MLMNVCCAIRYNLLKIRQEEDWARVPSIEMDSFEIFSLILTAEGGEAKRFLGLYSRSGDY